eukprot:Skav224174  [mRNA]  locus=scaffold2007:411362:424288:+ [translate_table: standard]
MRSARCQTYLDANSDGAVSSALEGLLRDLMEVAETRREENAASDLGSTDFEAVAKHAVKVNAAQQMQQRSSCEFLVPYCAPVRPRCATSLLRPRCFARAVAAAGAISASRWLGPASLSSSWRSNQLAVVIYVGHFDFVDLYLYKVVPLVVILATWPCWDYVTVFEATIGLGSVYFVDFDLWLCAAVLYGLDTDFVDDYVECFTLQGKMDDKKDDNRSFDNYIPVWDGRADSLREFRKSVQWWLCSIDLEKTKNFNLAARFAMRQKGSARVRALGFGSKDLEFEPAISVADPNDPDTTVEVSPAKYDVGVMKILDAWEDMVGRSVSDKKGELRERYYLSMRRGATESVANFALRYRTLIGEMKSEGITVDVAEQAWFYKQKLQLTEMQKQMLETTLGTNTEDYAERGLPSSSASSTASSWRRGGKGRGYSAHVTENEENLPQDDEEPFDGDPSEAFAAEGAGDGSEAPGDDDEELLGLQNMLEVLATDLDEAAAAGCDEEELGDLEAKVDEAVEALVTLREARTQINALKKDRGYHGKGSGGPPPKGRGKPAKGEVNKKDSLCYVCKQPGHWAGDPECRGGPKGGKGSPGKFPQPQRKPFPSSSSTSYRGGGRQEAHAAEVNVVDLLGEGFSGATMGGSVVHFNDKPDVHEVNVVEELYDQETEVLMVGTLAEALATSALGAGSLDVDKRYIAAVDTACNKTCAGDEWIELMKEAIQRGPPWIADLVDEQVAKDHFRFGNGGTLVSQRRVRLPVTLVGTTVLLWVSAIPCRSLGCLIGKDVLESLGAMLDVVNKKLQLQYLSERWVNLFRMKAGHFAVSLLPNNNKSWPKLSSQSWHAVGVGGVCEVQTEGRMAWKAKKLSVLKAPERAHGDLHFTTYVIPEICVSSLATAACDGSPYRDRQVLPCSAAMAAHGEPDVPPEAVALPGHLALDGAAPSLAAFAFAAPLRDDGGRVEEADGGLREPGNVAEVLATEGPGEDDRDPPSRSSVPEGTSGLGAVLPGGRDGQLRGGGSTSETPRSASAVSDSGNAGSPTRNRWPTARPGSGNPRAEGRLAAEQGGPDQIGGALPCGSRGPRHERADQGEAPTSSQAAHGQGEGQGRPEEADGQGEDSSSDYRWVSPMGRALRGGSSVRGSSVGRSPTSSSRSPSRTSSVRHGRGLQGQAGLHQGEPGADGAVAEGAGGISGPHGESQPGRASGSGRVELDPADGVLSAERRRQSRAVRKEIGTLSAASVKDMKRGTKLMVKQAVLKAKKIRKKLGAPKSYVQEVMEAQYESILDVIAGGELDLDPFLAEILIPEVPDPRGFRFEMQTPSLKLFERRPQEPEQDEWRAGHIEGWVCRDHYHVRRTLFHPGVATAPRFFPSGAFTGARRTVVMDNEGNVVEEIRDNFRVRTRNQRLRLDYDWMGETWLEVDRDWIMSQYPPVRVSEFRQEVQEVIFQHGEGAISYTLHDGDVVYLHRHTQDYMGLTPSRPNVAVSTFIFLYEPRTGGSWQMLEDRVRHRDRACHRLRHALLVKSAWIFMQIHYESYLREDGHVFHPISHDLYTERESVCNEALLRGHTVLPSISVEDDYLLTNKAHRKRATKVLTKNRPFCLIISFPRAVWSKPTPGRDPLTRARQANRRRIETEMAEFVAERALDQVLNGLHFVLEISAMHHVMRAGKLQKMFKERTNMQLYIANFDQCMFGLLGPGGGPCKRRTMVLTSSKRVWEELDEWTCDDSHEHEPIINEHKTKPTTGKYPPQLAQSILRGVEREFQDLYYEANAVDDMEDPYDEDEQDPGDGGDDDEDGADPDDDGEDSGPAPTTPRPEDPGEVEGIGGGLHADGEGRDPMDEYIDDVPVEPGEPSSADRKMALHLHSVLGHRPPLRLARALAMTGADPMLIKAAKELKCEVCHELQPTGTRRPGNIPRARHFGDRLFLDLFSVQDVQLNTHWVAHAVDAASRYQSGKVMEKKTTQAVLDFMEEWFRLLGTPLAVTVDMGPEFISEEFADRMAFHDVVVYHAPVEAPWVNGIAERAGGRLKTVLRAVFHQQSVIGPAEAQMALAASLEAVNSDIDGTGYSAAQMVLGKQPRTAGAAEPDIRTRMASNSAALEEPQFLRLVAFKEAARVALVRLQYSRALRRASVARPRIQPDYTKYSVGDVVYFFRKQKPVAKKKQLVQKKRLALRRWHGPGVILAIEGNQNTIPMAVYLAYKGNITKVAIEHVRHASALERLVAEDWDAILDEVVNAVDPHEPGGEPPALEDEPEARAEQDPYQGAERDDQGNVQPEAALPMLPEHRSVVPQPQTPVVFPFPFPSGMAAMTPAATTPKMASKASSRKASGRSTPQAAAAGVGGEQVPATPSQPSQLPLGDQGRLQPRAEDVAVPHTPTGVGVVPVDDDATKPAVETISDEDEVGASVPVTPPMPGDRTPRLEQAQAAVRRARSEGALEDRGDQKRPRELAREALVVNDHTLDVLNSESMQLHPLVQAVTWAQEDRLQGLLWEADHGTWDGRWNLPSSYEVNAMEEISGLWPTGGMEMEANTVESKSREIKWSELNEERREKYRQAARDQWAKWVENNAVKILTPEESRAVYQELQRKGEMERILQPRFVLTDKNSSLRTPENNLPELANARLIVQGFRDLANLRGELRKDAPTASRLAQHILCCLSAFNASWKLRSADVRAAFLKGDPYVRRLLYLCGTDGRRGPTIPLAAGVLAQVLKGIFGLADTFREWYLRLSREVTLEGWSCSSLDLALWLLFDKSPERRLRGALVAHVDDLLVTGELWEQQSITSHNAGQNDQPRLSELQPAVTLGSSYGYAASECCKAVFVLTKSGALAPSVASTFAIWGDASAHRRGVAQG